jgi:PEGA domain
VVDRAFAAREVEALERCLGEDVPWPCLAKALRDPAIQRVAVANLALGAAADGAQLVVITVNVALADPPVSYIRRRFCHPCTADTLTKLTTAAIKEILDLQYLDSGRTYLKVSSTPPGAAVVVDGKSVGVTDLAIEALPGPHRVVVTLAGKPPQIRTVEVMEDKTTELTVSFDPALPSSGPSGTRPPSDGREQPSSRPSRLFPATVLAVGALAMVGGVVALAYDDDQPARSPAEEEDQRSGYRNTAPLGVALLAAGAVTAGAGGWLWWRSSSGKVRTTSVSLGAGGHDRASRGRQPHLALVQGP